MRIAQVAPLYESVPPKLYGGTERVVSYLTEELVRLGHDVTLFASGDSETNARLVPACDRALWRDADCRETLPHHVRLMELVFREARRLGILRLVAVSLLLTDVLLGCDLTEQVTGLREIAAAQKLVAGIHGQITAMCEIPPESAAYFRFMLQVRERMSDRVRFVWRLATTPSVGEWRAMQMPDVLFRFYPIVRAVRLAHRFV